MRPSTDQIAAQNQAADLQRSDLPLGQRALEFFDGGEAKGLQSGGSRHILRPQLGGQQMLFLPGFPLTLSLKGISKSGADRQHDQIPQHIAPLHVHRAVRCLSRLTALPVMFGPATKTGDHRAQTPGGIEQQKHQRQQLDQIFVDQQITALAVQAGEIADERRIGDVIERQQQDADKAADADENAQQ
ncbi:MAG: hypothetical protein BWY83_02560 [bacterium ADurb.Bin478]|nr:MAG: hypothetical protein BWY83_02560 [bacterium ADurb.Bin478]